MKRLLTQSNINLLLFIARYRIVDAQQVADFFLTPLGRSASRDSAGNILRRLVERDVLSRDFAIVQAVDKTFRSRPKAVYFLRKQNLDTLKKELEKERQAEYWEDFLDYTESLTRSKVFSQNILHHELGISQFFLSLDAANITQKKFDLLEWIHTSPRHKDFSQTLSVPIRHKKTGREGKVKRPFNPDAFFFTKAGKTLTFFFLEYDTGTETAIDKISYKFQAYFSYWKSKTKFIDLMRTILPRYGLEVPAGTEEIPFRVLFITTSEKRRNALMLRASDLGSRSLFQFATLDDIQKAPFGACWISKNTFSGHLDEYRTNQQQMRPSVLKKWAEEHIESSGGAGLW